VPKMSFDVRGTDTQNILIMDDKSVPSG